MYDLDLIRAQVSLIALAEEAGAQFDHPHRLASRCPLPRHAGDRSSRAFVIYENGRRWKCHSSCPSDANSGDVFAFYMAWKGVDFKTAVAELADRKRIMPDISAIPPKSEPLPAPTAPEPAWQKRAGEFIAWAQENLASHSGAQAYLEHERGLSPNTWHTFRLGYNPENLYDDPARWGLDGKKIWLPRGIVIPGLWQGEPWYVKIRRPLAGQAIGQYLGEWTKRDSAPGVKFGGPRGGHSAFFGMQNIDHLPVLLLTEGEWDAMIAWEHCPDLCDTGTIGGAGAKFDILDLSLLTRYLAIRALYDDDNAGEQGRKYIASLHAKYSRLKAVSPPAHDLTDFWKAGGDLRGWVAGQVSSALENAFAGMNETSPIIRRWGRLAEWAREEALPTIG